LASLQKIEKVEEIQKGLPEKPAHEWKEELQMNVKITIISIAIALALFVLSACSSQTRPPAPATATLETIAIANPASTYCAEQGGASEIRTAEDGSQSGVCTFPDGSECEEWAFFRGECAL
jgi:putative hemolysin